MNFLTPALMSKVSIRDYVSKKLRENLIHTWSVELIPGNLEGIAPCFGRAIIII